MLVTGSAPLVAVKNPFANLALPSRSITPKTFTCKECFKSFAPSSAGPSAGDEFCHGCSKKASCWLCEPTIKGEEVVDPKADEQKETVAPVEPASKDEAQAPSSQDKLECPLSALTIVTDSEAVASSKIDEQLVAEHKQKAKEKDFDPKDENEDVWSARYDRLEARRMADAKKSPNITLHVYTVDPAGVL